MNGKISFGIKFIQYALLVATLFSACGEHTHTYDRTWLHDETHHWQKPTCGCDITDGYAEHILGEDGFCTVCGRTLSETAGVEYALLEEGKTAKTVGFWGDISFTRISIASIYNEVFVTEIGEGSFEDLDCITTVVLPETIVKIGVRAFSNCSSLEELTIPDSVLEIHSNAFSTCSNLQEIGIPQSVAFIGEFAFASSGLRSVAIPDGITRITRGCFTGCTKLTQINIGSGVKVIEESAFAHCVNLTSVKIPDGVQEIGKAAFNSCAKLESLILPKTVTCIGHFAFDSIFDLSIYYEGQAQAWSALERGEGTLPTVYFYSETEPTLNEDGTAYDGNYWRYDGKEPKPWVYENKEK